MLHTLVTPKVSGVFLYPKTYMTVYEYCVRFLDTTKNCSQTGRAVENIQFVKLEVIKVFGADIPQHFHSYHRNKCFLH